MRSENTISLHRFRLLGFFLFLLITSAAALSQGQISSSAVQQGRTWIRRGPSRSTAGATALLAPASNQFLGFFRFPAELKGEATVPMTGNIAYYRDFFEGGDTFTSGAQDGDSIGAIPFSLFLFLV